MREDLIACYRRLRTLGYDRRSSVRLALWACDPDQDLYPENK